MKLTDCEKQIMEYVIYGLTNKKIAKKLFVSISTVNATLHHIFFKLGINEETSTSNGQRLKASLIYLRDYKGIKGLDEYIENHSSQDAI